MLTIICKDKLRCILCPEKQFNINAQRSKNKLQLHLPLLGELEESSKPKTTLQESILKLLVLSQDSVAFSNIQQKLCMNGAT